MEALLRDIRYGIRILFKFPGFSATVVLALAFGIGANSATFSLVNAALLHALPSDQPEQLVALDDALLSLSGDPQSDREVLDWKDQVQTFSNLAAYSDQNGGVNLAHTGEPERVEGVEVSADFFSTFRVNAMQGRIFAPEEQQAGKNRVTVLSYALWQRSFGADPHLLNQQISLNGISFTVIGIAPPSFRFPGKAEFWIPISLGQDRIFTSRALSYAIIGRLKPGVTIDQAQADLEALQQKIMPDMQGTWLAERKVKVSSLLEQVVGKVRLSLWILSGAVLLVLLIACANVTNLLLVRAGTRQKEIAIRAALGASRLRLVRQLLVESTLLAFLGGAVGLFGAYWLLQFLVAFGPTEIPRLSEIRLDPQAILFTAIVCLLTGMLAGLAPALYALKVGLNHSLKEGAANLLGGSGQHRIKELFVVAEIALALLLLIGAGLLIKSLDQLQQVSPGFQASQVITASISLPRTKYSTAIQQTDFYQRLLERLRTVPGIGSVAAINDLPFAESGTIAFLFDIVGQPPTGKFKDRFASNLVISPEYFTVMGIPLLEGRFFTAQDTQASAKVVIINQSFAKRFWPTESPLHKQLQIAGDSRPVEIVGVVGDVKHFGLEAKSPQEMYSSYLQTSSSSLTTLVVRADSAASGIVKAIRNEVEALDHELPVYDVKTMTQWLDESMGQRRFISFTLSIFAIVALMLAASGIYSIMAYRVSQRTHEIGIRMALGAQRGQILKLILSNGLLLTLAGMLIGLAAALSLTRLLSSLLYNLQPLDPLVFTLTVLVLLLVALLACFIPAYKATRVDPLVALRQE
ncbi:MAG: ABC transporter permease [Acidobacteria bacterium]|nr:ABC transporter permease [Acidobacteriota bacterium]